MPDTLAEWQKLFDQPALEGTARDVILHSWSRSREAGLDPSSSEFKLCKVAEADYRLRARENRWLAPSCKQSVLESTPSNRRTMNRERVLKEAAVAENVVRYKVLEIAVGLSLSVVGLPFLVLAVPIAAWYWSRYYQHLRVTLTARELKVHRGILVQEDKSIPLEKITDLAVFQGPIMRHMGLKGIKVETAGQSTATGALVSIVGIEDTDGFRDLVLAQRDRIADRDDGDPALPAPAEPASAELAALLEIRDLLRRMDARLAPPAP